MRRLLYLAVALLYLLHQDFWLWDRLLLVGGWPAGLLYHLAYCFVTAALMGLLVTDAWPRGGGEEASSSR